MLVDGITTENVVQIGPQLVARAAWCELGMDRILDDAVLYDVTNTHFEGLYAKNLKARHGKNKQKRSDCRQVAIGMAFDERGLPLAHEVFEGNISDSKTLIHLLARLRAGSDEAGGKSGPEKPLVILDAGFASKANLALLKERRLGYLINITRCRRASYAEEFAAAGFEPVPGREPTAPVEVRSIPDPENPGGVLVLCHSALRREKELAMISRAETRYLADTVALRERIAKGHLKDETKIQRAIGRLEKNIRESPGFSPCATNPASSSSRATMENSARPTSYVAMMHCAPAVN